MMEELKKDKKKEKKEKFVDQINTNNKKYNLIINNLLNNV